MAKDKFEPKLLKVSKALRVLADGRRLRKVTVVRTGFASVSVKTGTASSFQPSV